MATKKQMQHLQNIIDGLDDMIIKMQADRHKFADECRKDALKMHNAANNLVRSIDDMEGDFMMSDLTRLREAVQETRKTYGITPPKDEEGREMYYSYEWELKQ